METKRWVISRFKPTHKFRLFCFSYAGGNATSFLDWQSSVHPAVNICALQLPGRGNRFHEEPLKDWTQLIETLSDVIRHNDEIPFAFFGHSLGGLLAFEVARFNMRNGLSMPSHLFISGCPAARYRSPSSKYHLLDDARLVNQLKQYGGTPPEILAHRELMELVLPTIRADFALVENYQYLSSLPLSIPITVMAGVQDKFDTALQIDGWADETTKTCDVHWFDGDHFFVHSCQPQVIDCINAGLRAYLGDGYLSTINTGAGHRADESLIALER